MKIESNIVEITDQSSGMDALHNVSNIPIYQKGNVKLINADCMKIMAQYPDKYFDLAVVDVPYGIGMSKNAGLSTKYNKKEWDFESPNINYFNELIRVSKNQIIWGANHFISKIPFNSTGWIVWDKRENIIPERTFADGELAYTSFKKPIRFFRFYWDGFLQKKKDFRIHPTQKPKELYNFCWKYADADKNFKILDTHGVSFNSAISAYYFGFTEFVGIEIDAEYFEKSIKRFEVETMQQVLSL